ELADHLVAVDLHRDLVAALDVLGVADHGLALPDAAQVRVRAEVDEHAEARLAEPRHALVTRLHRLAPPLHLRLVLQSLLAGALGAALLGAALPLRLGRRGG